MQLTTQQFQKFCPKTANPEVWCQLFNTYLPQYEIQTLPRMTAFLAQCAHESGEFRVLEENLNYSAQRLIQVFPRYFTAITAANYARKPQQIANRVYGSRLGNGPELSGDGWRYRGRGVIQLTGKTNYQQASQTLFSDDRLVENPDVVSEPELALLTACWFWQARGLNALCDAGEFEKLTRRINGGVNGLADRQAKLAKITDILQDKP